MSYELKKPITDKERADFIVEHNYKNGLTTEDTEMFLFALEKNEMMGEKEIEIDVPEYDEDGNPIMIEIEVEVPIYNDEGEIIGYEKIKKMVQKTHKETVKIPYPVINPDYEEEEAAKREAEFDKSFFSSSLGYIRRSVTMADGSHKDFLSDLLPVISMGVNAGQTVTILTYDKPPFDKDITDWAQYQHQVTVTAQFIQECFMQLNNDFLPRS